MRERAAPLAIKTVPSKFFRRYSQKNALVPSRNVIATDATPQSVTAKSEDFASPNLALED